MSLHIISYTSFEIQRNWDKLLHKRNFMHTHTLKN